MGEVFNWHNNDAVVVPQVDAIAVYPNQDGDIVIRQQCPTGGEDTFVVIPRGHVSVLIKALKGVTHKK